MSENSSNESRQELLFSSEETNKLQNIAKLYEAVKAAILFGEEVSPANITLPQILKELRDAFDHFMRVVAVKTNVNEVCNTGYVETNLDKVFGHVYRSAYDALDWLSIILRGQILMELNRYSASAITAAIPAYYTTIRPRLENIIPQEIARIRAIKDIAAPEPRSILEYAEYVNEIKSYWEIIVNVTPSLMGYSRRETKEKIRERIIYALIGAAITGLGIGLVLVFT